MNRFSQATYVVSYLVSLLLFSWSAVAGPKSAPTDIDQECRDYIKSLPPEYDYGWIDVKEDVLDPSSSKDLHIFYYHNYQTGKIPVVFFNGGPLSSSHGLIPAFSKFSDSRNIGMIYFDQRGTGCSSRIEMSQMIPNLLASASHFGTFEIAHDAEQIRKKFSAIYNGKFLVKVLVSALQIGISIYFREMWFQCTPMQDSTWIALSIFMQVE